MAGSNPTAASVSFVSRGAQCDDELISNLCAMPDFLIEEILASSSEEAAAACSSDSVEVDGKRARASENTGSKRGKK